MTLEDEISARPEFRENLFRSYGPGKFNTYADAYLYELALNGADDETEEDGTSYALMKGPFKHLDLRKSKGGIIANNDQGFVTVRWFTSAQTLNSEWNRICKEIESASSNDVY